MDNKNQESEENTPQQPAAPTKKSHALALVVLAAVVVVIASTLGTYMWQHKKVTGLDKQLNTVSATNTNLSKSVTKGTNTQAYVTETSVGYPLSLPHQKVITTLYLPADQNVMGIDPDVHTQAEQAAYYTESENDIIGNWVFKTKGTVSEPVQTAATTNQLYMSDMTQWEKTSDTAAVLYPASGGDGVQMTSNQKQTFVSQLKLEADACAKDSSKGFTTQDKAFNICYTVGHPQGVGGSWALSLKGYGELNGSPIYIGGGLQLGANNYQQTLQAYIGALSKLNTSVSAN
jgi:hypothetical protein